MRITLTLGGKYSNIRFDIPVPIADPLWEKLGEKLGLLNSEQKTIKAVEKIKSELRDELESDFISNLDKILAANRRQNGYGVVSG